MRATVDWQIANGLGVIVNPETRRTIHVREEQHERKTLPLLTESQFGFQVFELINDAQKQAVRFSLLPDTDVRRDHLKTLSRIGT